MNTKTLQHRWKQRVGQEPRIEDIEMFRTGSIDAALSNENTLDDVAADVKAHYPEYSDADIEQVFDNLAAYRLKQQELADQEARDQARRTAFWRKTSRWAAIGLIAGAGLAGGITSAVYLSQGYAEEIRDAGSQMKIESLEAELQEAQKRFAEEAEALNLERADFTEFMELQREQLRVEERAKQQDMVEKEAYLDASIAAMHLETFPQFDEVFAGEEYHAVFPNNRMHELGLEEITNTYVNVTGIDALEGEIPEAVSWWKTDLREREVTYHHEQDGATTKAYELSGDGIDRTVVVQWKGEDLVSMHTFHRHGSEVSDWVSGDYLPVPLSSVMQKDGTIYRIQHEKQGLAHWQDGEWVTDNFTEQLSEQSSELLKTIYHHRQAGPLAPVVNN